MATSSIIQEKAKQAVDILNEKNIDLWLTFVRETTLNSDPVLPLILGFDLTWMSALLIHRSGQRVAIVGRFDAKNVQKSGAYDTVLSYDQSIRNPLLEIIHRYNPQQIAINYSESDPSADGLAYGMFRQLTNILKDTSYEARLCSADGIIASLRGRKSVTEISRIKEAIFRTEEAIQQLSSILHPGITDLDIAAFLHDYVDNRQLETAWEREGCPIVTVGPESEFGHSRPSGLQAKKGGLIHVDFGIKVNGFCADLQRTWYLAENEQKAPPDEVLKAWAATSIALETGRQAIKPGTQACDVDKAARTCLLEQGYPEFMHAFGHMIGRTAHDGATILGPKWEKYGRAVEGIIETGNTFAIELGVFVPHRGYVSREENVEVTERGAEYLSTPQKAIWML